MKTALGVAMWLALRGWMPSIDAQARAHHVDSLTLAAIVWHESRGDPNARMDEHDGSCSIGLGAVRVPDCQPAIRVSELHDPEFNLRASATILRNATLWCARHPRDKHCRAGDKMFKGGGGVNRYAGATSRFAVEVAALRRAFRPHWVRFKRSQPPARPRPSRPRPPKRR